MSLKADLITTIASGLNRKAATVCSKWATTYRMMGGTYPGSYSFKYHPWCREMHDCQSEEMVGMKGAQLGFTEVALNKTFFWIDILNLSVLYVLPAAKPDAANFSSSRFDPALELSEHLAKIFSDVKNVGHKRAGSANLFITGSRSKSHLKSNPCALCVADELEEMVQENISLIPERMAGQKIKQMFKLSTPSLPGTGIDREYQASTCEVFAFKCPHCTRKVNLTFPECLVITADTPNDVKILDSHIICPECKHTLSHDDKPEYLNTGVWVPQHTNRIVRGFHVNQLYSCTMKPSEIARKYLLGLTNASEQQEFWNSKMGLPFEVEGARVTDAQINECIGEYQTQHHPRPGQVITIGIDVGKQIHYEVTEWHLKKVTKTLDINLLANAKVLKAGAVKHFHQLDQLLVHYKPRAVVIDIEPETRATYEFAQRFPGIVYRCNYTKGVSGNQIKISQNPEEHSVQVDRTGWLDLSLGRFQNQTIRLPFDISREYREHIQTLVRVYKKDNHGNEFGAYKKDENSPDHFAHARNYSEVALKLSLALMTSHDIRGVI